MVINRERKRERTTMNKTKQKDCTTSSKESTYQRKRGLLQIKAMHNSNLLAKYNLKLQRHLLPNCKNSD